MNVTCTLIGNGEVYCNETTYYSECNNTIDSGSDSSEGEISATEPLFWVYLLGYIFFVLFAGMEL